MYIRECIIIIGIPIIGNPSSTSDLTFNVRSKADDGLPPAVLLPQTDKSNRSNHVCELCGRYL